MEIFDTVNLQPVNSREYGEIVLTSLNSEAMPFIRYRLGDIAIILPYEPCSRGRTLPKMSMVKARIGDQINVGVKKVFPVDVEEVVVSVTGLGDQYQVTLDKPGEQDKLKVRTGYRHPRLRTFQR